MPRRRRRQRNTRLSHDSMLDIVTNSLGLLILVATLTAFSSQGIKFTLGAPIMYEADASKEVVQFEIREGGLYPIDLEFLEDEFVAFFESEYANKVDYAESFNARQVKTDYYELSLGAGDPGAGLYSGFIKLTPLENAVADRVADLDDPESEIRLKLKTMDPEKQWLFFLVREDSFQAFRKFREYLMAKGYEVGWTPVEDEEPLEFGPGGRSPTPG